MFTLISVITQLTALVLGARLLTLVVSHFSNNQSMKEQMFTPESKLSMILTFLICTPLMLTIRTYSMGYTTVSYTFGVIAFVMLGSVLLIPNKPDVNDVFKITKSTTAVVSLFAFASPYLIS